MAAGSPAEPWVLQEWNMQALLALSWQHSADRECKSDGTRPRDCMKLAPNCITVNTSASQQQHTPALSETVAKDARSSSSYSCCRRRTRAQRRGTVGERTGEAHAGEKERKASGLFSFASRKYKQYKFDLQLQAMLFDSNQSINQSITLSINQINLCTV